MLVDYSCIPKVSADLCGDSVVVEQNAENPAVGQKYIDYWSKVHNLTPPFDPYNQFWDDISGIFKEECCLELVKV